MSERRRKRRLPDIFGFGEDFPFGREPIEGGSGYSISVTYDDKGKPLVQVKTYGDMDVAALRKDLEQRYPGARIEGLEKQPLIRIVGEETRGKVRETEKKREVRKKDEKRSLIRVIE